MSLPPPIFVKNDLTRLLEKQLELLSEEIAKLSLAQVQGPGADSTYASLLARYAITPLELRWDAEEATQEEVTVDFPSDFGGVARRQEIRLRIRIPFTGDPDLFRVTPTGLSLNPPRAEIGRGYLEFIHQAQSHNLQSIRIDYDRNATLTKENVARVNEKVVPYNNQRLPDHIRAEMVARREKLLADQKGLDALGFKIRRHDQPPATYDLPIAQKTIQVPPAPQATPIPAPDPAISLRVYDDILKVLAGMSLAVERSPTAFARIEEEHLRDWFLVALNGHFHGDATGETFNNEGKTDIMIRVGGHPIFIAECKFWGGEKLLLETIDQLLGYLTWRDSKAALLIFSRNADFSAVLAQIPDVVRGHSHCRGDVASHGESGFRFQLRNKTDPDREHLVTLLAFNVPRPARS